MANSFIGEIKMFAGNFAPKGWALCDGQLIEIAQNTALFSLYGTTYGGDGRTTFGLPDLRGRLPVHKGTGPGLTGRTLGAKFGTETTSLSMNEMPSHTHQVLGYSDAGTMDDPQGNVFAGAMAYADRGDLVCCETSGTGGGRTHSNLQPALCVNFIVCLTGIFPSRT